MREGWEIVELDKYINLIDYRGRTPVKTESGVRLITAKNVKLGFLQTEPQEFIAEDNYESWMTRGIPNFGDVIFTTEAPLANVAQINTHEKLAFAQRIIVMQPKRDKILQDFLKYMLLSPDVRNNILDNGTGATVVGIKSKLLKRIPIPIPPLHEQKQIVAILDKAFAAIDQAKANIERNIENAKELFQSKLNEIFSQKGEGWEEKKLGEITTKIGSGATPKGGQAAYKKSGISLIRSMNVHDDGFKERNLAFIDEDQAGKLNNVTIEKNDVLLNITGASVARCCIVDNNFLPARVNQHVSIIRLKIGILNHELLHYILISKQTKDKLLGIGEQGSTRQAITKAQLENFSIKFPSDVAKQAALVYALNKIRCKSEKLVNYYNQKLLSLEELKKSILQKAFSGELTENDAIIEDIPMAAEPEQPYT